MKIQTDATIAKCLTEKDCNDAWIKQNPDNIEAKAEYDKKYTL